ncbi:hypothetical protein BH23GEM2_BH23GEM2_11510 [soil metagenome]
MTVSRTFELYRRNWLLILGFAGLSLWLGYTAPEQPSFVAAFMAAGLLVTIVVARPAAPPRMFLGAMAAVLIGYPFLGRGFAYIGVPPVFIGEIVLALGLATAVVNRRRWDAFHSRVAWVLVGVGVWGAFRTVPYLGTYRVDALRDAVVWGYGAFALLLVPLILQRGLLERVPAWFAGCIPWFLLWAPIAFTLSLAFGAQLPYFPGTTNVRILSVKPGDFGVHLGGIAAFLLLGLHRFPLARTQVSAIGRRWLHRAEAFWWIVWLLGFVAVASLNRGAMLAMLVAGGVVVLLRPGVAGRRVAWVSGIVVVFVLTLYAFDVTIERDGRDISARQVVDNTLSIAGSQPGAGGNLEGTKRWRLMWWEKIMGYTIHGQYFWTGKGFGINLAVDDGFKGSSGFLRSPHNGHLTVLARSGVPGIALWILLHSSFVIALVGAHLRSRRRGQELVALMSIWVLAYWSAFMVNATFDVALEGPHVGIPFWSLFGLGLALIIQSQRAISVKPGSQQGLRRSQSHNVPAPTAAVHHHFAQAAIKPGAARRYPRLPHDQ